MSAAGREAGWRVRLVRVYLEPAGGWLQQPWMTTGGRVL